MSVCDYCTAPLGPRVYRHEKGRHPEPRPTFCSHTCLAHYETRRSMEVRTFTMSRVALGLAYLTQIGILTWTVLA